MPAATWPSSDRRWKGIASVIRNPEATAGGRLDCRNPRSERREAEEINAQECPPQRGHPQIGGGRALRPSSVILKRRLAAVWIVGIRAVNGGKQRKSTRKNARRNVAILRSEVEGHCVRHP